MMTWLVLLLAFVAGVALFAIIDPRRPLRRLLLSLAAIHVVVFVAWTESNAIDCYPGCSAYQDVLGYLVWLALPVALILAALVAVWAGRNSR